MTTDLESPPAQAPRLRRLQLTMGLQCNVRCRMCYQTDYSPRFNMPAAVYRDRLRDTYPQLRMLKLIGGEPTIMRNCREVAQEIRAHPHVKLDLHTNGVRVDDFWLETFARQGGVISFSLNAASPEAYASIVRFGDFRSVVTTVERLVAARRGKDPRIRLTAVILKENAGELAAFVQLAHALGVDEATFMMDPVLSRSGLPPHGALRAELARAREAEAACGVHVSGLDQFERAFCPPQEGERTIWPSQARVTGRCAMPFHNLEVGSDGAVRICCNSWVKLGNLNASDLEEIWAGARARRFRSRVEGDDYLWCSPYCEDNPRPHRLALAHKLVAETVDDPRRVLRKVARKVRQLAGLTAPRAAR